MNLKKKKTVELYKAIYRCTLPIQHDETHLKGFKKLCTLNEIAGQVITVVNMYRIQLG